MYSMLEAVLAVGMLVPYFVTSRSLICCMHSCPTPTPPRPSRRHFGPDRLPTGLAASRGGPRQSRGPPAAGPPGHARYPVGSFECYPVAVLLSLRLRGVAGQSRAASLPWPVTAPEGGVPGRLSHVHSLLGGGGVVAADRGYRIPLLVRGSTIRSVI